MTLAAAGNYLQARLLTSSAAPNTICVLAALYKPIIQSLYAIHTECHTSLRVQEFLLLLIRFVCTDKSVQQLVGLFLRISAIRKACIPSS